MSIKDKIINSIQGAYVDEKPFSHVYIQKFFDDDFYNKLLNSLPNKKNYDQINKTGSVGKSYPDERYIFPMDNNRISALESKKKEALKDIINAFTSPDFFKATLDKFKNTIENRIKNFSDEENKSFGKKDFNFNIRIALIKDYTKYLLGSHTDVPRKFITFLFYLPKDKSLKKCGTSLYEPIDHSKFNAKLSYNMEDTTKYIMITDINIHCI